MKNINNLIVDLSISSREITYKDLSKILGIEYDEFCEKGGKMNNDKVGAINNEFIWVKNSGLDKNIEDLDLHLTSIINIFSNQEYKLMDLKKLGCNFQLSIIYYYYGINPGIHINSKYLNFFSKLGVNIDIDIYTL